MKTTQKILAAVVMFCAAGLLTSFILLNNAINPDSVVGPPKPTDWNMTGANAERYTLSVDTGIKHSGHASASLKYTGSDPKGYGAMVQMCEPGQYSGKRVRMTAYVKARDIDEMAGLWFRLDNESQHMLGFDNMYVGKTKRPIKKTKDWMQYSIVLDVPAKTYRMVYGALIWGEGQLWVDDIAFEIVDASVKTTGLTEKDLENPKENGPSKAYSYPYKPVPTNLDFEN